MKKQNFIKRIKRECGFTLIELMVVIAIIAILTGIIVTGLVSSRSKARDGQRISDLGQIQLALELYYDRCKQYPPETLMTAAVLSTVTSATCPSGVNASTYISKIPTDPTNSGSYVYTYKVNGTPPVDYVLKTVLENYNDILKNDMDNTDSVSPQGDLIFGTVDCGFKNNGQNTAERFYCLGPK